MAYQAEIITLINNAIKTNTLCDTRFNNAGIYGIAYDASEDGKVYPIVYNLNGDGSQVSPDDTYALQIYHKVTTKTYVNTNRSVGDRNNIITEKCDVKMVVMGWTNKLQLTQEDLESLIASNFPDQFSATAISPLKIQNLTVTLKGSNLAKESVFKEEYKGVDYAVKPEQILFSMTYTTESTYKKGCFIITDCQPAGVLQPN